MTKPFDGKQTNYPKRRVDPQLEKAWRNQPFVTPKSDPLSRQAQRNADRIAKSEEGGKKK